MNTILSTQDVPEKERFDYWNHLVSRALGRLDTVSERASSFSGEIYHQPLADLDFVTVTSNQLSVIRTEKLIAQETSETIKVNFHLAGRGQLTQNGVSTELTPGDWVVYDNTRPYTLAFAGSYKQLLVLVPKQLLSTQVRSLDTVLGHSLSTKMGMGKIIANFVTATVPEIENIPLQSRPQLVKTFIDLLASNLSQFPLSHIDPSIDITGSSPTVNVAMIKNHINTHLAQPDLSPGSIAKALHISTRYLHQLFQQEDSSIMRYIWQARLAQCRATLADPTQQQRSITEIAFTWGFNSGPHFSRLFKEHYGLSPRAYRNRSNLLTE